MNSQEGKVSFKSNKNVYVKFITTEKIMLGDTLLLHDGQQWVRALIVKQKSSTSCMTENISNVEASNGQSVVFNVKRSLVENVSRSESSIDLPIEIASPVTPDTTLSSELADDVQKKQITTGRLTFSTNASINPDDKNNFHRIRAAMTYNIQHIHHSDFSIQSYITYRHRYGIDQSTTDFYDDFKVFTLAVQYAPSEKYQIWFGRKINNNIANMGAIDGLQGEYVFGKYTAGVFLGSRPDFENFTFNAKLPQFGAYVVRNDVFGQGQAQTSIAFAEQQNDFKTDRRFVYFQHNNTVVKNLNFFFSSELDLYQNINNKATSKPSLTSMYASLRYRIRRNLSVSTSYDNRRNIIYYESYQTFIDQLLAQETRQGIRMQVSYSPAKKIHVNTSAFFRFQGNDTKPTTNYLMNVSFNSILRQSTNVSFNVNLLESLYFKGAITGGRISDYFFKRKLHAEINYRYIKYTFYNTESGLKQHIGGTNFSFNLLKSTTLIASYEGTYEPSKVWHRYFITITQRIKN